MKFNVSLLGISEEDNREKKGRAKIQRGHGWKFSRSKENMNPRIEEACKIPSISVRPQNFYECVGKTVLSYAFYGGSFCNVYIYTYYICIYIYIKNMQIFWPGNCF